MDKSLETPLSSLDFLTQGKNALCHDFETVGDILRLYAEEGELSADRILLRTPGFGNISLKQMKASLIEKGYSLQKKPAEVHSRKSVLRAMSTAPKDGTLIIVVTERFTELKVVFWGEYEDESGCSWFDVDGEEWGGVYADGWIDLPDEIAERMVEAMVASGVSVEVGKRADA